MEGLKDHLDRRAGFEVQIRAKELGKALGPHNSQKTLACWMEFDHDKRTVRIASERYEWGISTVVDAESITGRDGRAFLEVGDVAQIVSYFGSNGSNELVRIRGSYDTCTHVAITEVQAGPCVVRRMFTSNTAESESMRSLLEYARYTLPHTLVEGRTISQIIAAVLPLHDAIATNRSLHRMYCEYSDIVFLDVKTEAGGISAYLLDNYLCARSWADCTPLIGSYSAGLPLDFARAVAKLGKPSYLVFFDGKVGVVASDDSFVAVANDLRATMIRPVPPIDAEKMASGPKVNVAAAELSRAASAVDVFRMHGNGTVNLTVAGSVVLECGDQENGAVVSVDIYGPTGVEPQRFQVASHMFKAGIQGAIEAGVKMLSITGPLDGQRGYILAGDFYQFVAGRKVEVTNGVADHSGRGRTASSADRGAGAGSSTADVPEPAYANRAA